MIYFLLFHIDSEENVGGLLWVGGEDKGYVDPSPLKLLGDAPPSLPPSLPLSLSLSSLSLSLYANGAVTMDSGSCFHKRIWSAEYQLPMMLPILFCFVIQKRK